MTRLVALLLSVALALPACATARAANAQNAPRTPGGRPDRSVLVSYVTQLPVGARVKVTRLSGDHVRGTLMKATGEEIVVQRHTRIPETPVTIAIDDVRAVEIETPSNTGRSIAIGAAVGAGAALGVLLILAALFADN